MGYQNELKNTLDFNLGNEMIQLNMGYYINTAVSTGSEVSLTPISNAAGMGYAIISCSEGDMFTVKGTSSIGGGITCYLWAFLDSNNKLISKSNPNITVTDLIIMAPANTNKVVFNIKNGCGYKGETIENQKAIKFTDAVCSINPFISWTSGGYINHSTGEVNSNNSFMYTDYIEINTKELRMNKPFYGNAGIAFYDSAKGFISGSGVWNDNIDTDKIIYNINVPANAKFFRTSKINGRPDLIVADIGQFKYLDDTKNIEKLGYVNIPFMIDNAYIHYGTGEVVSNNQFKCTDFFPVYSETIYMQRPYYGNAGIAFYDSTKTYISGIADGAYPGPDLSVYKVSVPSGAKYLRTSLKKDFTNTAMFGSVDTGMETRLEALGTPAQYTIVCPTKIHVPFGIKYRYYPRQMCDNLALIEDERSVYYQSFTGDKTGSSFVGKEFGDFNCNLNGDQNIRLTIGFVDGSNNVINRSTKDITVKSFAKPTEKTAKVLFIGDSYIDYPWLTSQSSGVHSGEGVMSEIAKLANADSNTLTFMGTHLSYETAQGIDYYSEAYGGWNEENFVSSSENTYEGQQIYSPFYINGVANNFSTYFSTNGTPDIVVFFLGMNGGKGEDIDTMITAIKSASSSTKIIVCTTPPYFKYYYNVNEHSGQQYRMSQIVSQLSLFDNEENDGIVVCPTHLVFHNVLHFIYTEMPITDYSANPSTIKVCSNHHPNVDGVKTLANAIYGYLCYWLKDI